MTDSDKIICKDCGTEVLRCGRCQRPKCSCPHIKATHGPGKCGIGT